MENPYGSTVLISDEKPIDRPDDSARTVFLAWEKLRLVYNVILALLTLVSGIRLWLDANFWQTVCLGALAANVCFCVGPILEGYLSLVGLPRRPMRWLLFLFGTGLACLLAIEFVVSHHLRDFAIDF